MLAITAIALAIGFLTGLIVDWPALGLWLAGFPPAIYGIILLVRKRPGQGAAAVIMGVAAGIWGIAQVPAADPVEAAPPIASSSPVQTAMAEPTPTVTEAAEPTTAQEVVALLEVKGRGPKTGYERKLFNWNGYDFDRNGCDQRNDTLKRDMRNHTFRAGSNDCYVEEGWLQDRYSGTAQYLTRDLVEIDHVVSLSDAWQMGAAGWSEQTRREFANDPLNLVATTSAMNSQKSDSNAASWLPPRGRCDFVARQAAVKWTYELAVIAAEKEAFERVLADCPDHPLPTGDEVAPRQRETIQPTTTAQPTTAEPTTASAAPTTRPPSTRPTASEPTKAVPTKAAPTQAAPTTRAPEVTTQAPPAEPQAPAGQDTDPQFRTCKDAKANGYGPYVRGKDPEYHWYRDADGDGVACE